MPLYEIEGPFGQPLTIEAEKDLSDADIEQIARGQMEQAFPRPQPGMTLGQVLRLPVMQMPEAETDVVRATLPGSMQPSDLRPALRLVGGDILEGKKGETHPDIIDEHDVPAEDLDQRGFVGPEGQFIDREAAANATLIPTEFEPGRLHSTDLRQAQEKKAAAAPIEGSTSTLANLPAAIFGATDEAKERLQNISAARAQIPREQALRMMESIEANYRQKLKMLPWDTDPARANMMASQLEKAKADAVAKLGFETIDAFQRPHLGEPLTEQQQELLFGKGLGGTAAGAAQRTAQGFANIIVQPEMMPMAPGAGVVERALLPEGERFFARIAGKTTPMVQTGATIGTAYTPIMAEEMLAQASQAVGQLSAGDLKAAAESGIGAAATGLMLAMPVDAARRAHDLKVRRGAFREESPELQLANIEEQLKTDISEPQRVELQTKRAELQDRIDQREGREQEVADAFKGTGRKFEITDRDLGSGVIGQRNSDGSISINRRMLHIFLDVETRGNQHLISKAIKSLVNQEVIHAAIPDAEAAEFWGLLSPAERALEERIYPFPEEATASTRGQEAIRRRIELANGLTPGEYFSRVMGERMSARAMTALLRAIGATRESLSLAGKSKAKLNRQIEILNNAQKNIIEARKGATDARKIEKAAEVHGYVRPHGEPAREVPVPEGVERVQPQAEGRIPLEAKAQVPLKPEEAPPTERPGEAPPSAPAEGKAMEAAAEAPAAAPEPAIAEAKPAIGEAQPPVKREGTVTEAPKPEPAAAPESDAVKLERLNKILMERELTGPEMDQLDELMAKKPRGEAPAMRMREAEEEATRRPPLIPAVRSDEGNIIETGPNHAAARIKHGRAGRIAFLPQNEGFLDRNGNFVSRKEGAKKFEEITGRPPRIPDALQSEDLKSAGLLEAPAPAMRMREEEGPPEGYVRLYHGEGGPAGAGLGGSWFTTKPDRAATYGPNVTFVDVPADVAAKGHDAVAAQGKPAKFDAILPDEWARRAQPVTRPAEAPVWDLEAAPAMRIKDMSESDLQDYLRPILAAAGNDPAKKQAAYDFVTSQIQKEEIEEFEANRPKPEPTELGIGPGETITLAGRQIRGALNAYLQSPLDPKDPISFNRFVRYIKEYAPQIQEDQVRWLWGEGVYDHLINASGARLAEWRRLLKMESRYGRGPIADPPLSQIDPADPRLTPEQRKLAKINAGIVDLADPTLTPEERARAEQVGRDIAEQNRKRLQDILEATKGMSEAKVLEYIAKAKTRRQSEQNYRNRIISEVALRLANQAIKIRRGLFRDSINVDDIDFENDRTVLGAYYTLLRSEAKSLKWMHGHLALDASPGKEFTKTTTQRVTVLVNRDTGNFELVSTYKAPKKAGEPETVRVYDPVGPPSLDKQHTSLENVLKKYRVRNSLLLRDPVKNFHIRIEGDPETGRSAEQVFMEMIGNEGLKREEVDLDTWLEFQKKSETQKKAEFAAAEEQRFPTTEREKEHLATWAEAEERPEESAEELSAEERVAGEGLETLTPAQREQRSAWAAAAAPPTTRVTEGQGAGLIGPKAGIIRAQTGMLRFKLDQISRGPMHHAEADGFATMLENWEVSGVQDIRDALRGLQILAHQEEVPGQRRGLRGLEYSAMVAVDKAAMRNYQSALKTTKEGWRLRLHDARIDNLEKTIDRTKNPAEKAKLENQVEKEMAERKRLSEGMKMQALYSGLMDLYEIAEKHTKRYTYGGEAKFDINHEAFVADVLERYGDHTRRAFESAAAQAVSPTAREIWEKRTALPTPARAQRGWIEPLGRRAELPRELTPEASQYVRGRAEATMPGRLPPLELRTFGELRPAAKAKQVAIYRQGPQFQALLTPPTGARYSRAEGRMIPPEEKLTRRVVGPIGRQVEINPAMRMREYGIAERLRRERAGAGLTMPIGPGQGMNAEELVKLGQERLRQGADPEAALQKFSDPNHFNPQDAAVVRAHGEELARQAERIHDKEGRNSPEYRKAFRASALWDMRTKALQTEWAEMGRVQQGATEVDTGTFTGLQRAYRERTGKDFTEDQAQEADGYVERDKTATRAAHKAKAKVTEAMSAPEPLEPQIKSMADRIVAALHKESEGALARIRRRRAEGRMFAGIPPEDLADYAVFGATKMAELSMKGALKFSRWSAEMMKDLGDYIKPHLRQIWDASQTRLDKTVNAMAPEPAQAPVREAVTRPDPTTTLNREEVIKEMAKVGNRFTPQQARVVWNYMKKQYLDKGVTDYPTIVSRVATDLGMSNEQVHRALSAKKGVRKITNEMYRRLYDQRQVKLQALNWLRNQEYPGWLRFTRKVPRFFFAAKVFGHGTVGLITHAPWMLFQPQSWKAYFPAWRDMYGMAFSKAFHERRMTELLNDPNFITARRAGLANDPFRYTDDYQVVALNRWLSKLPMGNRGFDALKTLRQARWNQLWEATPEHLKTQEMAKLWADLVNHATGVVKSVFPEAANWTFFAPKLEASRWAFMLRDPAKAAYIFGHWRSSLPEERYWAMSELKTKATMFGLYVSLLAMNQGLLKAIGSDQDVNFTNPRKSDWLSFKIAGYKVGVVGPMIGMVRLFVNLFRDATAQRSKLERLSTRREAAAKDIMRYVQGKLSPFASFATSAFFQSDVFGRPMPWSEDKLLKYQRRMGKEKYTYPEWAVESVAPIPAEEAIREVWRGQGMSEDQIKIWLRALGSAVPMAATGARVTEDEPR